MLLLITVTACQPRGKEIVIGGITSMTGPLAHYGEMMKNIIDLRIDQWNELGVLNGKKIKIKWVDGACNEAVATKAARELVYGDGVDIIIGGICSDEALAVAKVASPKEVLFITSLSSSSELTDIGDFIFRTIPSSTSQGKVLAIGLDKKSIMKVGILIEESSYTKGLLNEFLNHYRGELIEEVIHSDIRSIEDKVSILNDLEIKNIVILVQSPDTAGKIVKVLNREGWNGNFYANEHLVQKVSLVEENADFLLRNNAVSVAYLLNENEGKLDRFSQAYLDKYGNQPAELQFATTTLDAVDVLVEAISSTKKYWKTKSLREALLNNQYVGFSGGITFHPNGDLKRDFHLLQFDGQKFVRMD